MESLSDSGEGSVRRTWAKFAKAGAGKLVSRTLGALRKHPDAKTKPCTHRRNQRLGCEARNACAAARAALWIGFCNSALKHLPPRCTKIQLDALPPLEGQAGILAEVLETFFTFTASRLHSSAAAAIIEP